MKTDLLWNFLFPRRCPVCGEITEPAGSLICPSCLPKLSLIWQPTCKKCGKEIADSTEEFCESCKKHRRSFEYGLALFHYNEAARHSMAQIKYNNKREYLDFYGAAMAARYGHAFQRMGADCLIPVPIHPSRRRERGFNQAEVLADIVGERLGIPVRPELLVRRKKTKPQKDLAPAERLENLSGAFAAGCMDKNVKSVILIDDIYTTGSTIEACARALKEAGVERVYFAVLCAAGG